MPELSELDMSVNCLGASGAISMAESLHHMSRLVVFKANSNHIGDDGARALAESLVNLRNLVVFDVGGNHRNGRCHSHR